MILTKDSIVKTPVNFLKAEQGLLSQTGGDAIFWSGRAATSLYHAYQLAKRHHADVAHPEIIMPAMMCATASNTAIIADITPRFADIAPNSGVVTLQTIQARYTSNTIAVVVIHLLGNLVDIDPIVKWCKEKNLLLIEDPTQALGAQYRDGDYVGSRGDVAIYSFNKTKIISVGNGVLLSNSSATTQALVDIAKTPFDYPQIDDNRRLQLALSYRNLHHALVGLLRVNHPQDAVAEAFLAVRSAFDPLYLRPVNSDIDLNTAWENLPKSLEHRLRLANIYAQELSNHSAWQLMKGFQQSGVCWRFSLLINTPEQQVNFSEAVRRDGFHVSNLYWAINPFFRPSDVCDNADMFSRQIVNLWVDDSVDEDYVRRCCASLLKHADRLL